MRKSCHGLSLVCIQNISTRIAIFMAFHSALHTYTGMSLGNFSLRFMSVKVLSHQGHFNLGVGSNWPYLQHSTQSPSWCLFFVEHLTQFQYHTSDWQAHLLHYSNNGSDITAVKHLLTAQKNLKDNSFLNLITLLLYGR